AGQFTMYELATLYFVARGLQSEKKAYGAFLAAGFFAAAGFYTYIAYRIFPLVVLVFVLQKSLRAGLRRQLGPIIAASILAAALIAPMAVYYVQNSAAFTARVNHTLVWKRKGRNRAAEPERLVLEATVNTIGIFNWKGDAIARHNVGVEPMFSPFSTAFF